jgi:hypothetical protein
LRAIAGRRLRLSHLIVEFARRFGIFAADGPRLEAETVVYLLSQAAVIDRAPTAGELVEMQGPR